MYGKKFTRKMANMEMKYSTKKIKKKNYTQNREDSDFPQQCDNPKLLKIYQKVSTERELC